MSQLKYYNTLTSQWQPMVVGATGYQGSRGYLGSTGPQGPTGFTGSTGTQGNVGYTGSRGDKGDQGDQGLIGTTGTQGPRGFTGDQGVSLVLIGSSATITTSTVGYGMPGQGWINTTDGNVYFWNTLTVNWENIGPIVGPQGVPGVEGPRGQQGPQGNTGTQGISGTQGVLGQQGVQGLLGYQGTQGVLGQQGVQGLLGYQGTQGVLGQQGVQGNVGFTGSTGTQGSIGYTGSTGTQGNIGYTGSTGTQGNVGFTGSTGTQGNIGYTGSTGTQGVIGFTGSTGTQGVPGPSDSILSTNDTTSTLLYPVMVNASGSNQTPKVSTSKLYFDSLSGVFTVVGEIVAQKLTIEYTTITTTIVQTDDIIKTFNTTESTSTSTGALIVSGGVGIGGSVYAGPIYDSGKRVINTATNNTGITINNNQISTIYNSVIADVVQSVAVGGAAIAAASSWKTKTIVEVLDTILFPDQYPTYTIPSISLAGTTGVREIGTSLSQALTLTATENDSGIFTQLTLSRDGTQISIVSSPSYISSSTIANQYGYTDPNNPNYVYSLSYTDSVTVVSGNTNWSGVGTYSSGLAKQNNKGVTDTRSFAIRSTSAPQLGSTINSSNITITGIYPYFYGKSSTPITAAQIATAIQSNLGTKVLLDASGTITVTYAASAEYIWVAHYSSYTSKTKWYNSELNKGDIGTGNFILSPVTNLVTTTNWSGVSYKIYISDIATVTAGAIEFRNT